MAVSDRTLMAAALGLLDPGDDLLLGDALGTGEHLRQSGLAALAGVALPNARSGPTAARSSAGLLGARGGPLRVGDRASFLLEWPDLPEGARCAVFRRAAGQTRRLYPGPSTWTPLSRFRKRDGHPLLELIIEPPAGQQQLDVVLVAGELTATPWPEGDAAWGLLHQAWLEGRGYGVTIEVEVG